MVKPHKPEYTKGIIILIYKLCWIVITLNIRVFSEVEFNYNNNT